MNITEITAAIRQAPIPAVFAYDIAAALADSFADLLRSDGYMPAMVPASAALDYAADQLANFCQWQAELERIEHYEQGKKPS